MPNDGTFSIRMIWELCRTIGISLVLLSLLAPPDAESEGASVVRAKSLEISTASACPTEDADLRALERRVRIALLRQQRPLDEDERRAWSAWSEPVVLELVRRPDKPFDLSVLESSGEWPVDSGAMGAVVSSGASILPCPADSWRIHLTFEPPAVPEEKHVEELVAYLNDPDPWAVYLAAEQLVELGHREKAIAALEAILSSPGPLLPEAATHALDRGLTGNEAQFFKEVEGSYQSSIYGGCVLTLHRDASFSLACEAQPRRWGRAEMANHAVIVPGPQSTSDYAMPLMRSPLPAASNRPDAARDPTVGPYVVRDMEVLWLVPLRWGSRLYLIRDGHYEAFCRAIEVGDEPRGTPLGNQFLRSGDHELPTGSEIPTECEASGP